MFGVQTEKDKGAVYISRQKSEGEGFVQFG